MRIADMIQDPSYNPASNQGRGAWSLRDVTSGEVFLDATWRKPTCIAHGAMNCVAVSRLIWRCLTCGRSCIDLDRL